MRRLITIAFWAYIGVQIYVISTFAERGVLGNLTVWNVVRPAAIIICYVLYTIEGGRWALWLAIWAATGALRALLVISSLPLLAQLEAGSELALAAVAFFAWRGDPGSAYFSHRLIDRIKAWFLPAPELTIVPLGADFDEVQRELKMLKPLEEESHLKDCEHYEYDLRDQRITIAVDDGKVRGVIYDTDTFGHDAPHQIRKLRHYLSAHSAGDQLRFLVNNGFGFLYRSSSGETRAAYSYAADIFSVSDFSYEMA